jgi:type IV pilus assembly protein PilA
MDVRESWLQIQEPTPTMMLELLICLVVAGVMIMATARTTRGIWQHVYVVEAISVMSGPRVAMMEYYAVTGVWPTSNEQAAFSAPETIKGGRLGAEEIRDGGVDFAFSERANTLAGKIVTIRAWQGSGAGDLPVTWLCGHARAAPTLNALSDDRTTLADGELPSPCRSRN